MMHEKRFSNATPLVLGPVLFAHSGLIWPTVS